MSRIGKMPIHLPKGVEISISDDNVLTVKGPKGELKQQINPIITMKLEDGVLNFERPSDSKEHKALHGLYRALANNMVVGVSEGYKKEMELVGVGYRVENQGNLITFTLGYTHPIVVQLPKEITVMPKFLLAILWTSLKRFDITMSLI